MDPGLKLFQGQRNGKKRIKDILGTWQQELLLLEVLDHGVLPGWRKGMKTGGDRWAGEEEETALMIMKRRIPGPVSCSS